MDTSMTLSLQNIPLQYQCFKGAFEKKKVDMLLKHSSYNCAIELQDGGQPLYGSIYNLSQTKLVVFQEYIDKIFAKGFIQYSKFLLKYQSYL